MTTFTATYSPDDNKLRLYASERLPKDLYERVRGAGFIWAPKQGLFVAPMWTPSREDLCMELAGEIGDEDTSLTERAEERAERFDDYSDKRANDADQASKTVQAICDGIPMGQPILVGHHSEKRARKDAERIENGMRKAVKMWETSEYWKSRAKGAIHHAKYKERSDVRARRIKTIEAAKRKQERTISESTALVKAWTDPAKVLHRKDGQPVTLRELVIFLANRDGGYYASEYSHASGYIGPLSLWEAAGGNINDKDPETVAIATPEQICAKAIQNHQGRTAWATRWLAHYNNRLEYERAMLDDAGGTVAQKTGPDKGGACQCWASPRGGWSYIQKVNKVSVTVLDNWGNGGGNFTRTIPFDKLARIMTAAEVQAAREAGNVKETDDKTGFYLLQSREQFDKAEEQAVQPIQPNNATKFDAMRETLKTGVQIISAPQLFPTPADLAARMVDLAGIEPGHRVLEPSAGTGRILGAMGGRMFGHNPERGEAVAVEINNRLADGLRHDFPLTTVKCADFTQCNGELGTFDRILMNPPFINANDVKHIKHALHMLKSGGRLVALCADGPRQREALQPLADMWEELPAGTFKESETGVSVALLVITG